MKYIVKCPYCDKNYIVESEHNETFTCPNCGGLGDASNVIQTDNETERIHQAARLLLRQHLKDVAEEKEDAINSYKARRPVSFMDLPDEDLVEDDSNIQDTDSYEEYYSHEKEPIAESEPVAETDSAPDNSSSDTSTIIGVFAFFFCVFLLLMACIVENYNANKVASQNPQPNSVHVTAQSTTNSSGSNILTNDINTEDNTEDSTFTKMNTSADTENIRTMLDTLITATAQNDYDTIMDNISGPDQYPWINTYDWFAHYLNTSLGKYLGDESIEFIDATYIKICQWNDSHRDAFFYQKAFYYKVELSDGSKETLCVGLTSNDKWVLGLDIDTYTDMLWFTEFAVPCNETYNESVSTSFILNGFDMANYTNEKPSIVYTYRDETSTEKERFLIFQIPCLIPGEQTIMIDVGPEHYEQTLEISSDGRYYID